MQVETKQPFYDVIKVREAAEGRWLEILAYLAPSELSDAFAKPGKHVTCPVHGTKNVNGVGNGFRLFKNVAKTGGGVCNTCGDYSNGVSLLMWLLGWDFGTVLREVAQCVNVEAEIPGNRPASKVHRSRSPTKVPATSKELTATRANPQTAVSNDRKEKYIAKVWEDSTKLDQGLPTPLLRYFQRRSILLRNSILQRNECLRFHPALPYSEEVDGRMQVLGRYPALIGAIKDMDADGEIITLLRTYLTPRGCKAKVEHARKMMPFPDSRSVCGAAIPLGGLPASGVLGVAEGIETALSAIRATGIPTWSAVNKSLLERFILPPNVHTLLIWADWDMTGAGQESAQALKEVIEPSGVAVHILIPSPLTKQSRDWNNVMCEEGIMGFPRPRLLGRLLAEGMRQCAS